MLSFSALSFQTEKHPNVLNPLKLLALSMNVGLKFKSDFKKSNLLLLKAGLIMFTVQLSYRLLLKYEALDPGEETSDEPKPLINNANQEVNHRSSEELERTYAKVLWLQQHIVSPGQTWRMFRWTLEVLGHLKRKKKTHKTACFIKYKTPPV